MINIVIFGASTVHRGRSSGSSGLGLMMMMRMRAKGALPETLQVIEYRCVDIYLLLL